MCGDGRLMIPLLWKRVFFDRCHYASCDKYLGTYMGRRYDCTTKGEMSKGKRLAVAVAGLSQY